MILVFSNCVYSCMHPIHALISISSARSIYKNKLTKKEVEIAELVMDGCSNKIIAKKLFITDKTVKTHLNQI